MNTTSKRSNLTTSIRPASISQRDGHSAGHKMLYCVLHGGLRARFGLWLKILNNTILRIISGHVSEREQGYLAERRAAQFEILSRDSEA